MNDSDHTGSHSPRDTEEAALVRERTELLQRVESALETPMLVLAFAWLALLVLELTRGESPLFEVLGTLIWVVFLLNFGVELILAPDKSQYFRRNWLTAVSLLVPAFRIVRVLRIARLLRLARAGRGLRLLRVVSSLNRGMHALGSSLSQRGFGYVVALTVLVTFAGAAGIYAFERTTPGGLDRYSEALWWTAMVMTTMGSQDWPQTAEGRVLCVCLSLYAFAVFGYVTATLATFFVGRDAGSDKAVLAGARELNALKSEIASLRSEILTMSQRLAR